MLTVGHNRYSRKRLKQHKYDVNNKHVATNALAEPAVTTGHGIDWDNAKIGEEKNKTARLYLKSFHFKFPSS